MDETPPLDDRYRLGERFEQRGPVERFDATATDGSAVVIARQPLAPVGDEPLPIPTWPDLAWEIDLRLRARTLGLSRVIDTFANGDFDYLVLGRPEGVSFWDAWDDPAVGAYERFGWLAQLAVLLRDLHNAGAILERLRPDFVVITPLGQVLLDANAPLLPLPLPAGASLLPFVESPPELTAGGPVDARADLYNFGALLCALELGRELTDLDFAGPGQPKPFVERFPDAHPALGRLLLKTLQPDVTQRFPSDAGGDPSGFDELAQVLGQTQRSLGRVRLDIAAWTSTGTTRPANEDAFGFVHTAEMRDGVQDEAALVILADGMGGSLAGEVAAGMTIRSLRGSLLRQPPFAALAEGHDLGPSPTDRDATTGRLAAALRDANRAVYLAARQNPNFHGMGCTAEAVYLDGRQVMVAHVGDSRTYRLHRGRLMQLTQDHTVVRHLVEMGQISVEEADSHPRRSELRQAIGGRPDVEPDVAIQPLVPGDWVLVCSDGLSARLSARSMQNILEVSPSAEAAARRLVNAANLAGAFDNVTVVVVRAT